jgi:MFS family permease
MKVTVNSYAVKGFRPVDARTQAAPALPSEPGEPEQPSLSARHVWFLVFATAGAWMAVVAPTSYSMAIRVNQLTPAHPENLGYVLGAGSAAIVVSGPVMGVLSDRTKSRLGRRRPYLIGGALLGLAALLVVATAPDMLVLTLGWLLVATCWQTTVNAIMNLQADKLSDQQRGTVSGLTGFAMLVAPVIGVGLATASVGNNLELLLVPALFGLALIVPLAIWSPEEDTRTAVTSGRLSARLVFGKFVFSPRRYPDFAWNWVGRFAFWTGITFNTVFLTFLLAQRLGVPVKKAGGAVVALALLSVLALAIGAVAGGRLSDRFQRRRVFVLFAGVLFGVGAFTMAFSSDLAVLLAGAAVANLGLGMFSAVDQAVLLDVLPSRAESGRYIGIVTYAQQIPHAIAPVLGYLLLAVGASGGEKNYTILYLIGGALTVLGGLIIMLRVKGSR